MVPSCNMWMQVFYMICYSPLPVYEQNGWLDVPPGTRIWLLFSFDVGCMRRVDSTSYHTAYIGSMNRELADKISSGSGQGRIPLSVACVVRRSQLSKRGWSDRSLESLHNDLSLQSPKFTTSRLIFWSQISLHIPPILCDWSGGHHFHFEQFVREYILCIRHCQSACNH